MTVSLEWSTWGFHGNPLLSPLRVTITEENTHGVCVVSRLRASVQSHRAWWRAWLCYYNLCDYRQSGFVSISSPVKWENDIPTSHGCCENYLANNVFNKYQLLLLPSCLNSAIPKMFNNRCILIRETCHFRVFETGSIFLIFSSIIFGEVIGQWPMSLYANE